jgi:hypothetical protein
MTGFKKFGRELDCFFREKIKERYGIEGSRITELRYVRGDRHPYWCYVVIGKEFYAPLSLGSRLELLEAVMDFIEGYEDIRKIFI